MVHPDSQEKTANDMSVACQLVQKTKHSINCL